MRFLSASRRALMLVGAVLASACTDSSVVEPRLAPTGAASASTSPSSTTVLIFTPSVSGGAGSQEAQAATGLGYTVVFKNATEWAAMTATDFAQYRAIIIGDPVCSSINAVQAAVNNRNVWGPVVNGNVFIIGSDPAFHGKTLVAQKGIAFAAAAAGKTGAYITTSCYSSSAASLLLGLSNLGTFVATSSSGNNALKVAEHPALDGLTSAYLSNWNSSVHNGFSQWPSDFEVLGIIGTGTVYRSPDGSFVGTPYILARGEGLTIVSDIALTPQTTNVTINTTHTFSATVLKNGAAVAGKTVTFTVVDGPTAGTTSTATTNSEGVATYSITAASPATYGVRASFVDDRGVTQTSGRASVTFAQPADATPPEITPVVTGTAGHDDFYTSDVSLTWTVVDNESDITSKTGCDAVSMTADNAGVTYTCSATSTGGTSSKSVTLKRDASAPLLDAVVVGPQGANGWYTGTVLVTWNRSDATSGIEAFDGEHGGTDPCLDHTLTTNTASVTYTCTVENGAGLTTTKSVTIKRDATAPVVVGTPNGTLGNNGWYLSDVTVSWATSDDVSGASSCAANTLSSDNASTTFSCTSTNGAGFSTSSSVSVKRDATKPVVAFSGNAGAYTVDQTVTITCAASDNLSGVAGTTGCTTISGAAYSFVLGANNYAATATDNAGNSASASTAFTVSVTGTSVCSLIKRFVSQSGIANSMCVKVNAQSWKALQNELSAQSGKAITAENATLLSNLVDVLSRQ